MEAAGTGTRDDMSAIALWAVGAGIIGARLYHVVTDWSSFDGDLGRIVQIWKGGLGIPGGLMFGVPVGLYVGKRRGIAPAMLATCAAPAIPLAQAIGRWGNWFNQELFGGPTTLPWGLEVSDEKAVAAGYPPGTTFHPTFLYESLWNFALCGALLWIDRKWRPRPGMLMGFYFIGYGAGRFWVEGMRIDRANEFGGLRVNQWIALLMMLGGLAYVLWARGRPYPAQPVVGPDGAAQSADEESVDEESVDEVAVQEVQADEVPPDEVPADGPAESGQDDAHDYVADDG
jgi:prolipoprotein diacylglyceryl transferase